MGLFRPYERTQRDERKGKDGAASSRLTELNPKAQRRAAKATSAPAAASPAQQETTSVSGKKMVKRAPRHKDAPTPTRAQREAERMERLHPTRSPKEQRKADREARAQQRTDSWDQMESTRERTLVRDYVDSRWTIAEFMLPAMLLVMAGVMVTMPWPEVSTYIALVLWVLMFATLVSLILVPSLMLLAADAREQGRLLLGMLAQRWSNRPEA